MTLRLEWGRVLVVDDTELNRVLARAMLQPLGWQVDEADSAEAALAHLARHRPEQVLLDLRMPGMGGLALAPQIRQLYQAPDRVQIVAYTAQARPLDKELMRAAGFDAMLIKPVSLADMTQWFGRRAGAVPPSR